MGQHEQAVRVRVICHFPPSQAHEGRPTSFGLQTKDRNVERGMQHQDGIEWHECLLTVWGDPEEGAPDFGGAYVHGLKGARFLYLSYVTYDDQSAQETPLRRLKIPLGTITWAQITEAQRGGVIETAIDGRGAATAPLLGEGWQVREA